MKRLLLARARRLPAMTAVVVVVLGACTPAIYQRDGHPVVTADEDIRLQVASARVEMDSALHGADLPRLVRRMTPDVTVVLASGDSASGRDSVAALINRKFAHSIGARFQMFPSKKDVCLDGAVEYESDVIVFVAYADKIDTLTEKYAAKWRNAAGATWLLQRLVLGPASADRRTVAGVCERISIALFNASRLRLTILPSILSVQPVLAKTALESGLRRAGFQTSNFTTTPGEKAAGYGAGNEGGPTGLATLRWRVANAWSIEGVANYTPQTFAVVGRGGTLVRIEVKNQMAGAMAQYEWDRWRVGGGLMMVMSDWSEAELDPGPAITTRRQAATTAIGPLIAGGYTIPIASRFGIELWGMYRSAEDQIPAWGTFPPGVSVRVDALAIGITAVIAF